MEQVVRMLISVGVGLGACFGLFVGANKLLDQSRSRWPLLPAALGVIVGAVAGAALQHNGWFPRGFVGIVLGAAIGGAVGYGVGLARQPSLASRGNWEVRLRPIVFVGPAVAFVLFGLVVPSLRTLIVSFKEGKRGTGSFALTQYRQIFTDDDVWNVDNWTGIFTSRLFIAALFAVCVAGVAAWATTQRFLDTDHAAVAHRVLRTMAWILGTVAFVVVAGFVEAIVRDPNRSTIFDILTVIVSSPVTLAIVAAGVVAIAVYWWSGRHKGEHRRLDWSTPGSSSMIVLAVILTLFAVLSTLQSTIWNNLWWVVTVAGLSTVFGLLLAMLADRSRRESWAKTMIFMPMAISMVGAAVIWDFVYTFRPGPNQIGLFNAVLSNLGFQPRGFFVNASMIPWNNVWIMVIMIWIQTGFAMVVLSAAIKAVPDELIESARVDGATEVQVFWQVIIPRIKPTILVVLTTLIIIVMKVFDLVKATTNGVNRTDVLANAMFNELRNANFALSSAFAVLIFALTLPVMIYNIRRAQREIS